MMQPQLQVIYSDYKADDHRDSTNTLIQTDDGTQVSTRVGVRWFSNAEAQPVKPFVETNGWHYSGDTVIAFNQTRVEYDKAPDVAEFKIGLESDLGQNLKIWGHAGSSVSLELKSMRITAVCWGQLPLVSLCALERQHDDINASVSFCPAPVNDR